MEHGVFRKMKSGRMSEEYEVRISWTWHHGKTYE